MGYNSESIHEILTCLAELCRLAPESDRNAKLLDSVEERLNRELAKIHTPLYIVISAVSKMLNEADPWTVVHQRHVAQIGTAIGRNLGWKEDGLEIVETAALLQDFGKLCTPSDFAAERGSGSDPGAIFFREHSRYSYEIFRRVGCVADAVRRAVLQHHELIDGSGYPAGLSGPAIVLEAKVLSLADAIDTIVTGSVRDSSQGVESALDEIRRHRGTRYDPSCVDACLAVFGNKRIQYPHLL